MRPAIADSAASGISIPYTLPASGEVTLGLYDDHGGLLRWIERGVYHPAGRNQANWDGLDQWGHKVSAGHYNLKVLYHPPLGLDYGLTLGNPGTPPWITVDGKGDWLSDEQDPQGAATDGKWVFLAAPGSEKGFAIIGVDEAGQRQWGVQVDFYPRCVSLAVKGDELYALFSGPELTDSSKHFNGHNAQGKAVLMCLDKHTGQPARFSKTTPRLTIATWPYREQAVGLWELRTSNQFTPATYGGQPRYFCNDLGEPTNALGIAAANGRLYASLFDDDKLLVLDAASGRQVGQIPLAKPVGLHATADGKILAVSEGKVVSVDPASGQNHLLIAHDLSAPHSLTTDSSGNIYVSDWGDSFQVKVFSPAGKLVRSIGKAGGRPWIGKWEDDGMLVPRGIAVTDSGKLWVAEDDSTPKRISVWDAATGAFLKQYIGPTSYGGGGAFWMDAKDPTIGYTLGTRFKLDWQKRTYTPLAVVTRRMDRDAPFALNGHATLCNPKVIYHDGREYLAVFDRGILSILMRKGDIYVPVAAVGGISRLITDEGTGNQIWDSDIGYHLYKSFYPECFHGHAGDNFCWVDSNGDGLVQPEEMHWIKTLARGEHYAEGRQPEWLTGWGFGIGPDWSIYVAGFCRDAEVAYRLDPKGWTRDGAPIYDPTDARRIYLSREPASINGIYVNRENKLFLSFGYEFQKNRKDVLACLDRDGHQLWALAMPPHPESTTDDVVSLENIVGDFNVPALGNVLGLWLWHGNYRPYLVTSDGMYVSTLLEDTKVGPASLWDESLKNYFQTPDGSAYLVNGASDGHHILKITGLDRAGRFEQPLELTEEQVKAAAAGRAMPAVHERPKPIVGITWLQSAPKIDGDLADWDLNAGVRLDGGKGRSAQVALGRDAEHLYLAYHVHGSTLVNKGDDWQTLFISGDCVDLMLATDPHASAHREQAAAGDIRLLLGIYHDKPIAVLYRPVVAGAASPVQLMAARIDEIRPLDHAQVAYVRGDGEYSIEAAVPLKDLGIDPAETATLRGDVGVIYADDTGRSRSLRLYYYNHQTNITADLTTEATLQPDQWGRVELPLGPNLLKNGGFESALVANPRVGWAMTSHRAGGEALISDNLAFTGTHGLLLQQTKHVEFPPDSYSFPDYDRFIRSANAGAGGGQITVQQTIPVVGGHRYSLRVHYLAEGLKSEQKKPGPGRGYAALSTWLYWGGGPPGVNLSHVWVTNEQADTASQWKEIVNQQANYWSVLHPYLAPDGATTATITFTLVTNAAGVMPRVWVDDVELLEDRAEK